MSQRVFLIASVLLCACWITANGKYAEEPSQRWATASTVSEARSRALLLHEMTNGTLRIMHRDFFDDENTRNIPSASLEDVFLEIEKGFRVEMKWLTVNTDIVNVDHQASTDFEKAAVKALAAGAPYTEEVTTDRYRFVGAIPLSSQCLKCHVKLRTSTEDRTAGLIITMPIVSK